MEYSYHSPEYLAAAEDMFWGRVNDDPTPSEIDDFDLDRDLLEGF